MTNTEIMHRIEQLKKEKNAVILAHYYTRPEVQDIADYLGDSLGLAQEAAKNKCRHYYILRGTFHGRNCSHYLSRQKSTDTRSGGWMFSGRKHYGIRTERMEKNNPEGVIVSYVNTTAEVKAWTDICCTSANALEVVKSIPADKKILFVPDRNLGAWISKVTGRPMELWNGNCCVHERITTEMILNKSLEYPQAEILIHPESRCSHDEKILNLPQAYLYSTAGMIRHAANSPAKQFIIATETETIHKLQKRQSGKRIHSRSSADHLWTNEKNNPSQRMRSFGKRAVHRNGCGRNPAKSFTSD